MDQKSISPARLRELQKIIGVRFHKEKGLISALAHTCCRNRPDQALTFERLEFFGDALLNFAICEKLFHKFPQANEGLLSRLRSTLVSKKVLLRVAKTLKLRHFLITQGNGVIQDLANSKLLSDLLEAVIGAIFLDRGLTHVQKFVWKHWERYFDEKKLIRLDPNPKSTLQELSQKFFHVLPIYEVKLLRKTGFQASVRILKKMMGSGKGLSKQAAEEEAALKLVRKLKSKKTYSRLLKKATREA
ncbi:MAG: ribonuclease III [Candidatus Omnitrophica bacterium]|nr:ribonuclease III [Candidatus Omnitrophota bacterium]